MNVSCGDPYVFEPLVQAVLYGMYTATLPHTLRWLFFRDEGWELRANINWPMVAVTIYLWIVLSTSLGISLQTALFIIAGRNLSTEGVALTFVNASGCTAFLMVDAVLIYRCWVIHDRKWIIIFPPLVLWVVDFACAVVGNVWYGIGALNPARLDLSLLWRSKIYIVFYACTMTTNVYATSAIIYHILSVTRGSDDRLYRTCRIIADSGILLTFTMVVTLVTRVTMAESVRLQPLADICCSVNFFMAGIAFNLILVRVGQQRLLARESGGDKSAESSLQFHVHHSTIEYETSDDLHGMEKHGGQRGCIIHDSGLSTLEDIDKHDGSADLKDTDVDPITNTK